MVFSSSIFLFLFLPFVLLGYYLLKESYRNTYLLLVSLLFYAYGEPRFILVMLASIAINYLCGLWIAAVAGKGLLLRRCVLAFTVVGNLSMLFYFKYYNFFIETVNEVARSSIPLREIVLPIGISFFTFQGMSYTLDLYLGKVGLQKNPLKLALYISLFPQLIAGPIVRYKDVNDQIDSRECSVDKFALGIRRFVIGLAKKAIIANQVGLVADSIFNVPASENTVAVAWLGAICYTFQIYFDFSGYSDMAIGLGKMFGFDFLENFNYPYVSSNITGFWRRWHISMSTWFRDYIYIPLGGNRSGNVYVNLLVVFLVTGLWHGAAWNFVLWGLWHGMFLLIERIINKRGVRIKIPIVLKWFYTMLVIILGWVLFRSPNLSYAWEYIGVMFGLVAPANVGFTVGWYLTSKIMTMLVIGSFACVPWKRVFPTFFEKISGTNLDYAVKAGSILMLFIITIMFVMTSTYNPFIYFRF